MFSFIFNAIVALFQHALHGFNTESAITLWDLYKKALVDL